jgi:hypothetical protein
VFMNDKYGSFAMLLFSKEFHFIHLDLFILMFFSQFSWLTSDLGLSYRSEVLLNLANIQKVQLPSSLES